MRFSRVVLTLLPFALLMTAPVVHATPVLSNLNQTIGGATNDPYIGQAFVTGPSSSFLSSVTLDIGYTPVTPELEFEASNADGTVGSTLYTISGPSTYSFSSGQLTFTAPTSFSLAANTDYFLVFSDPGATVDWEYTDSPTYTAQLGFTIPANDAAFESSVDNTVSGRGSQYYTLASGPELFSLSTSVATPEPSTLGYMGMGPLAVLFLRRRLASARR